jgi:hypothetical protein
MASRTRMTVAVLAFGLLTTPAFARKPIHPTDQLFSSNTLQASQKQQAIWIRLTPAANALQPSLVNFGVCGADEEGWVLPPNLIVLAVYSDELENVPARTSSELNLVDLTANERSSGLLPAISTVFWAGASSGTVIYLPASYTAVYSVGGESMEEAAIFQQNSDGPAALLVSNDDPVQINTAASPNGTDDSAAANQFFEFSGAILQAPGGAPDPGH